MTHRQDHWPEEPPQCDAASGTTPKPWGDVNAQQKQGWKVTCRGDAGAAQGVRLRPGGAGAAQAHLVDQLREAGANGAAAAVAAAAAHVGLAAAAACHNVRQCLRTV